MDKKEKLVSIDELDSEELTSFSSQNKITSPLETEVEDKRKQFYFFKLKAGQKSLNYSFLMKEGGLLFFSILLYYFSTMIETQNLIGDELSIFAVDIALSSLSLFIRFLSFVFGAISFFYFFHAKLFIFKGHYFELDYDGIFGARTITPNGTSFYRRKIKWVDISEVKVITNVREPYIEIKKGGSVELMLPLYLSNLKAFKKAAINLTPKKNPFGLVINKFKKY